MNKTSFSNPIPHLIPPCKLIKVFVFRLDCRLRKCVIHRWNVRRTFRKTCGIWWQNMLKFSKQQKCQTNLEKKLWQFVSGTRHQGIDHDPMHICSVSHPDRPEHRYFASETAYSYPLWPQKNNNAALMANTDITDRIFLKFWWVSPNLEKTKKRKKNSNFWRSFPWLSLDPQKGKKTQMLFLVFCMACL